LRRWARHHEGKLSILRVPGIYAADRLPLERLRQGTPALLDSDDVYTNHIHADDLAQIIALALFRAPPLRIYHTVDDSALKMGDYFTSAAALYGLPAPTRISRAEAEVQIAPMQLSFMSESRRMVNSRMKRELGLRLRFPDVLDGLAPP
jgi:nucleoside-diphosphate-sugar epimerase